MSASLFPPSSDSASLLREAAKLLVDELDLLSGERWEDLPELKRQKVVLASRLRQIEWSSVARESWALQQVLTLISNLEAQAHRKTRDAIDLADRKIFALQELNLYCRECDSISLRRNAQVPTEF